MKNRPNFWVLNLSILLSFLLAGAVTADSDSDTLTICQHLRQAESRRAKLFDDSHTATKVRVPKCTKSGDFEPIQCADEANGRDCWCVDSYGVRVPGTHQELKSDIVSCNVTSVCPESSCRMFCPSGFNRDARSGCRVCQCRDPCEGVTCPGSLECQPTEIKCAKEPCPPIPTCRKSRSLDDLCPAGAPLTITDTVRPFLCGNEAGKPACPPTYKCMVQPGNDYGVCCQAPVVFEKPGICPKASDSSEYVCGSTCAHDLECPQLQKCCESETDLCGAGKHCQMPSNVTTCHQYKMLSDLLALNDREGRGYVPNCDGSSGAFTPRQCSRNGLVCWCVDAQNGHKIEGSMGAAALVTCDAVQKKSSGRSFDMSNNCDKNICAAICEYGFKNDHNNCPTCECSEPCEGYQCPNGFHCEVARDAKCSSGSALCAAEPICKPDIVYSNPCEIGSPLVINITDEVLYCVEEVPSDSRQFQAKSFFDDDEDTTDRRARQLSDCPSQFVCTKLHSSAQSVCCPKAEENLEAGSDTLELETDRRQTMCEYLRDFSSRMVGTEEEMFLALPSPACNTDGSYQAKQCVRKKKFLSRAEQKRIQELKNRRLMGLSESVEQRSAKIVDANSFNYQMIDRIDAKVSYNKPKKHFQNGGGPSVDRSEEMLEVLVDECWCVDGFGTEIPASRTNGTQAMSCERLRQSIDCLDITCRMGCDFGFILDPETKCPTCECRDPCDGTVCPENYECRSVDVACEGEYCPPVPACLPKKPGQCPFLVPPGTEGSDIDSCEYECRSDSHCETNKKCCSNGCGTQCIEPQLKTACQHLQTIQYHTSFELGVPAKQKYIAQCDEVTGKFNEIQCGPLNICWCVDEQGNEVIGTKTFNGATPDCRQKESRINGCPMYECSVHCERGYLTDTKGCKTCQCQDPCDQITCPVGEQCQLLTVYCTDEPCPKMPICVPQHDTVCTEGAPLKRNDKIISCGPQRDADQCPSTHSCQLDVTSRRGVCCGKTRDVCFESIESTCIESKSNRSNELTQIWQFSPKLNKCVYKSVSKSCHTKNSFHSESACASVCPTLTSCERLKLRNELAARRVGQMVSWFQPRCDPDTGSWSPIQCLGTTLEENEVGRSVRSTGGMGVCWCADKVGAPLKGSLTRDFEPTCNYRQARRKSLVAPERIMDPVMEELIRQMTVIGNDIEHDLTMGTDDDDMLAEDFGEEYTTAMSTVTDKLLKRVDHLPRATSKSTTKLVITSTRCLSLKKTASFPVACNANGSFVPTQCNDEFCWCVDEAGNQLPFSGTFKIGEAKQKCPHTPIDSVTIQLHLTNDKGVKFENLDDVIRSELTAILEREPANLVVREHEADQSVLVTFDLMDETKIDKTFAIEEMVKQNHFVLGDGVLRPDITLSRFLHRSTDLPMPLRSMGQQEQESNGHVGTMRSVGITESTFQTIIFVITTTSAFLVSVLVVFIMLKRGKSKLKNYNTNKTVPKDMGMGDKFLDYSAPIFVLSASDKDNE